jgi:hypothetical protein
MTSEVHEALDALDELISTFPPEKDADLLAASAYAVTSLAWSSVRVAGGNASEHPVIREVDRVKLYMQKLKDRKK